MVTLPLKAIVSPLRLDDAGVVRIGASRVTLDTLVGAYCEGSTAEEIVQQFPSLALADVHTAIAYYLTHRPDVEAYLESRARDALELRRQVEALARDRATDPRQRYRSRPPE